MKRFLIIMVVVIMSLSNAHAADYPIDQGSFAIEGSMYLRYQGGDLYENRAGDPLMTIIINPEIKYFISPGVYLGALFGLESYSQGSATADNILFGPSVGYYLNSDPMREIIKGSVYPFGSIFALFGSNEEGTAITSFGGRLGALYMLSDAVGVDFSLRMSRDSYQFNSGTSSGRTLTAGIGVMSFVY